MALELTRVPREGKRQGKGPEAGRPLLHLQPMAREAGAGAASVREKMQGKVTQA